jgi:hypothetical protein
MLVWFIVVLNQQVATWMLIVAPRIFMTGKGTAASDQRLCGIDAELKITWRNNDSVSWIGFN